jgi:hypothetical protein|mmetsp:Transcript_95821/g.161092  ORF Transcript_95821/g.161092 Transcript_95821/m.161092 type:complete len:83 (+) Transcript_95821:1156-1404(+)
MAHVFITHAHVMYYSQAVGAHTHKTSKFNQRKQPSSGLDCTDRTTPSHTVQSRRIAGWRRDDGIAPEISKCNNFVLQNSADG